MDTSVCNQTIQHEVDEKIEQRRINSPLLTNKNPKNIRRILVKDVAKEKLHEANFESDKFDVYSYIPELEELPIQDQEPNLTPDQSYKTNSDQKFL